MKVGVVTCAYNEERFIKACIRQFDGFDVEHLVLVSLTPWQGSAMEEVDNTAQIAKDNGATVIEGNWSRDEDQRHFGLDYFKDKGFDWCLVVDTDEFYTKESLDKIFSFLNDSPDREIYKPSEMLVYWKDLDHIVTPTQGPPVLAMRPHQRFSSVRDVYYDNFYIPGTTLHHLSYVRTDAEMVKKISSWGHAHELVPNWYQDVWLKWREGDKNFHPTVPNVFEDAVKSPLPLEIKKLLGWSLKEI